MALEPSRHLEHGQVDGACARHHDGGGGAVPAGADGPPARPEAKKVQASHRRGRRCDSVSGSGHCRRREVNIDRAKSDTLELCRRPNRPPPRCRVRITTTLSKSMFVLPYMQMKE